MIPKIKSLKFYTIFLVLFTLLNIIAGVIIFADIQIINAPKAEVNVEILEVNSEEIKLQADMKITNDNSFLIEMSDFEITSMSNDGKEIGKLKISGGEIKPSTTENFTAQEIIDFQETGDLTVIKNKITGEIGVEFLGFIKKTIPVEIMVSTSFEEILKSIEMPEIVIETDFENLTSQGLGFTASVNVFNPNKIEMSISEFSLTALANGTSEVGSLYIQGGTIKPNQSSSFESKGTILFDAFDAQELVFKLKGDASLRVGGVSKKISLETDTKILIPDITEFIFENEFVEFQIPVQFKLRLDGIHSFVGFKIFNPSEIPVYGENLICRIYREDEEDLTLLAEKEMDTYKISPHEKESLQTEVVIPYRNFIFSGAGKFLPNWIVLQIEGDLAIAGTKQAVPLSLNAYVDPHLIRNFE